MPRLVCLASTNKHKLAEISVVAAALGFEVSLCRNGEKLEIQSDDITRIAFEAARVLVEHGVRNAIVEDAGLFIGALSGFPGPYSSYAYRTIGCRGILKLLEGESNRRAYFESVMAYIDGYGRIRASRGRVYGLIAHRASGRGGFGFDPIFIPAGYSRTFAEMSLEEKAWISHRGKAAAGLFKWLAYHKKEI